MVDTFVTDVGTTQRRFPPPGAWADGDDGRIRRAPLRARAVRDRRRRRHLRGAGPGNRRAGDALERRRPICASCWRTRCSAPTRSAACWSCSCRAWRRPPRSAAWRCCCWSGAASCCCRRSRAPTATSPTLTPGRLRARVTSAEPLTPTAVDRVRRALEERTGKKVIVETAVDASLIGGVVAQVGDLVLDGSVRTQLRRAPHQARVN